LFPLQVGFQLSLSRLAECGVLSSSSLDCVTCLFFSQRSSVLGYDLSATIDFPVSFLVHLFHFYFIQLRLSVEVRSPRYLSSLILFGTPSGLVCYVLLSQSRFAIV